jgi:hypothetical protein
MDLTSIFSIAGKPGLYQLVTQSKSGVLVQNLEDGKKVHADASSKISGLSDISIYTETEEKLLTEVLLAAKSHFDGKPFEINLSKETAKMVETFEAILPNYDKDRVYNSDIKKIFKWYNILLASDLLTEEVAEEKTEEAKAE